MIELSAKISDARKSEMEAAMRLTIITLCTVTLASSAALAAEPTGDWRVEDGSAIIRIDNCRGALWGVVAWEKVPGRDERSAPVARQATVCVPRQCADEALH